MLDSGSPLNFITEEFSEKLGLRKSPINFSVIGIGSVESSIKFSCDVNSSLAHYSFRRSIKCLVIRKIADKLPSINIKHEV